MRWWWLAAFGVIACGTRARNEPLPAIPPRDAPVVVLPPEPQPSRMRTVDAIETAATAWVDLGITGDNWRERLASIDPADRPWMAMSLLRAGEFDCPGITLSAGTCKQTEVFRDVMPESSIADPCLRRLLALWATDQLSDDDLYQVYDELSGLVQLGPPEVALAMAVLARFDSGFEAVQLRWTAEAVGHTDLPDVNVVASLDHEDLRRAAEHLHYDAAVLALDPIADLDLYLGALQDSYLQLETKLVVLDRLVAVADEVDEEDRDFIQDALRSQSYNGDCVEAAAATAAIAELAGGGRIELPSGPFVSEDGVIAATCATLAMDVRGSAWRQVISKQGIEVAAEREDPFRVDALWTRYPFAYDHDLDGVPDVPEADPDGDGNVATTREETTRRWHKRFTLPYADELKLALPHCQGNVCKIPDSTVWFELEMAKERGTKLRLRRITRHERVGSDC